MSNSIFRHRKNRWGNHQSGFTVIELGVVVALVAILAAVSLIIFDKAHRQYKLSQNARNLASQIERARSLAVKYNQTLTLGFTANNTVFGLTCTTCSEPKKELPDYSMPTGVTLSAYPTLTIRGNGTISSTSMTVVANNGQGYQVSISIANSGRTTVGDVSTRSTSY